MTDVGKEGNFLDLIPERNCRWEKTGDGRVYLLVPRFKNRWLKKIALKLGKSELVKIYFDNIGSTAWELIDGTKTVEQIGKLMEVEKDNASGKEETETKNRAVDRAYARLTEFVRILYRNRFVRFKNYS
jgi:hypothetical protein